MADQTLDQLPSEITPDDADLLYLVRNGADRKMLRGTLVSGLVPATRQVITSGGISGGGNLTANRTLSLDIPSLSEDTAPDAAADYTVVHDASAGTHRRVRLDRLPSATGAPPNTFSTVAVPGNASVAATAPAQTLTLSPGANISVSTNAATSTISFAASGLVPTTRTVSAGAGLSGGGSLAADRTLSVNVIGQSEDPSPALANHYILTHDTSANALRRIRASLLGGGTYVLPPATASVLGGVKVGAGLAVDVAGLLSATYSLPAATENVLGGIKVGAGLDVTADGTLSAPLPIASSTTLGAVRVGSGLTSDGAGTLSAVAATPYTLPVASAGTLGGVRVGTGLAIDGSGVLSATATGGGGGGGGTFATQAEAQAGVSAATYMSPLRTREAIDAYADANELGGAEGQVVRFDADGNAVAGNATRAVMVPVFAETAAVATGTAIRKFPWPVALRLTRVEGYTPTAGTGATTFNVRVTTSIFTTAPTIAANASSVAVTTFTQPNLARSAVVEIDVTAAGAGAKGLWVTFTGIEA